MNNCKPLIRFMSMASNKLNLKGVITPLITPFTSTGEIDFDKLEHNVRKFEREVNLTGYNIGSNSEQAALTPSERVEIVRRIRKIVKPEKMIIGGATAESTKLAIEMSKAMADAGANGVLVMTPYYFKRVMTEEAIIRHFTTLADSIPIPVVIYNMSMITGIEIGVETLAKLADHPNIRGVKDSDVRKMAMTVIETKGKNFDVLAGSAGYLLSAMQLGCSGGIVALAGPLGSECVKLASLVTQKRWEEAIDLQKRLIPIDILYFGSNNYGVPGLKATMKLKGFECGYCRQPLKDVSEATLQHIKHVLQDNGFC